MGLDTTGLFLSFLTLRVFTHCAEPMFVKDFANLSRYCLISGLHLTEDFF